MHYVDSDIYVSFGLTAALLVGWAAPLRAQERELGREKRAVTVRDAISMTRLGLPENVLSGPVPDAGAKFSPNNKRFVIVLKKGNPDHDTNDYSVVLCQTLDVFRFSKPKVLFTLSSSSNREAVRGIKWLADNETLVFIGENPGELPQIYEFKIPTSTLKRITHHVTGVIAFDMSTDGRTLLFESDPPVKDQIGRSASSAPSLVISNQSLTNLLVGNCAGFIPTAAQGEQLFLMRDGEREIQVPLDDVLYAEYLRPSLSPNGRYGVFGVFVRDIPLSWLGYKEQWLRDSINMRPRQGEAATAVARYMVLTTDSGDLRPLLNSPVSSWQNDAVVWAPDGSSVIVSGVHLPLDGVKDPAEKELRRGNSYAVEVRLPTLDVKQITDRPLRVTAWNSKLGRVIFTQDNWPNKAEQIIFTHEGGVWKEVMASVPSDSNAEHIDILAKEDINSPPRIYALNSKTGDKAMLLDLNPQFSKLDFAKGEVVTWRATDGHEVQGGLLMPSNYRVGEEYPLVIQTHGFLPGKFYMDGPWSSGFAAQPLVGKGIVVLQVGYSTKHDDDDPQNVNTPREAERQMAAYEGAIEYLNRRGIIDSKRVGIIGFSRTVYEVAYTLTHSKYRFAAATFVDGITGGYFEYMVFPELTNIPKLNGGRPFGSALMSWLKNSPSFNLDKLNVPLRIEAYGPESLVGFWDWYSGLSLLKKPVDFVYLPRAPHLLVKPSERLISEQGNVDWFCFWLKGEEDLDPQRREQYKRWEIFRNSGARIRDNTLPD